LPFHIVLGHLSTLPVFWGLLGTVRGIVSRSSLIIRHGADGLDG
jgi:hypothetical protein